MNPSLRRVLLIFGLAVMCIALCALVYAFWPLGTLQEQIPLAPTLLAPP